MPRTAVAAVLLAAATSISLAQAPAKNSAPSAAPAAPPRFGIAEPKAKAPGAIRVATYNLENLFDDKDDPAISGELDDADDTKPDAEKKGLAAVIKRLDADVIAVEEIENNDALVEFRDNYLKGMGYDYVKSIGPGDERGIEQGILSRFPIKDAKVWENIDLGGTHPEYAGDRPNKLAGQPLKTRRSPFMATVEVPADKAGGTAYDLTLFVVHHKSSRGMEYWREAEAKKFSAMVDEIEAANPKQNIVVLGDFNAEQTDESVQIWLRSGFECVSCAHPDSMDPAHISHASGRTIDMILVNPALKHEVVPNSTFVLATPQLPAGADWKTTPKPDGYASDHMPVAIDLTPKDE